VGYRLLKAIGFFMQLAKKTRSSSVFESTARDFRRSSVEYERVVPATLVRVAVGDSQAFSK
jgi:hypothetical protein